ncbi:peptidoglycan bridge formation glycyltransferase FemA/FemB family protein [Peribacillus sp. NPDC097225]|uniref:peptidoglycan bridge formation glycyltransferase FemA/FemB family protein n=1 Tax=Peribacillus sp. NPDC097225 TaxID=3364400 RepID=UPI00380BAFFD
MEGFNVFESSLSEKIIHLGTEDDWVKVIEKFQHLDIYYSKEYLNLFAAFEDGLTEAVFYENEDGKVFYPFIKRKIDIKEGYFDIITPYGYGGPVLEGKPSVIKKFYEHFNNYCLNNNIITETISLHPLINNYDYIKNTMRVDYIRRTEAIDLTLSLEEIRNNYSSTNKRNIRKAIREGVQVNVSNTREDIEIFMNLYYETMDRNNASKFYYFNKSYFYGQMEETKLSKSYLLLARFNEQIIGGILLIIGKEFAHYHLGASKTEYLFLRPNNLLFDTMIEFTKSFDLKALHLGGGYKENDSLYKFKKSFSNNDSLYYFLGKNIINEKIYNELSKSIINDFSGSSKTDFFPSYRDLT